MPKNFWHRTPLPEQQDELQAREQHIGAALHRSGHILRPPSLELLARHQTVLHREQGHQQEIDGERFSDRGGRAVVDRLWHHEICHEADGIEKCSEKHQIGDKPVKKCGDFEYSISRYVWANGLSLGHNLLQFGQQRGSRQKGSLRLNDAWNAAARLCATLDLSLRRT